MKLRQCLTLPLLGLLLQSTLLAKANAYADTAESVAVVELFTSEGCSSCPPADALLRQVHLRRTQRGQLIVGISEHVTYWNGLGWRDPYSMTDFTQRQEAYAARFSPEGPYTPQMVVNGREAFVGSNAGALQTALSNDAKRPHLALSILSATASAHQVHLRFALRDRPDKPVEIIAVISDDTEHSNVQRGENSGRSLDHVSVARVLTRVTTLDHEAEETVGIDVPDSLHLVPGSGHHLILFAQEQHQGSIVAAAAAAL